MDKSSTMLQFSEERPVPDTPENSLISQLENCQSSDPEENSIRSNETKEFMTFHPRVKELEIEESVEIDRTQQVNY